VTKRKQATFDHSGSTFDSFLEEEGILEEVDSAAIKRVIAWQLSQAMKERKLTKKGHGGTHRHQSLATGSAARS
jgi:hypothetical protein